MPKMAQIESKQCSRATSSSLQMTSMRICLTLSLNPATCNNAPQRISRYLCFITRRGRFTQKAQHSYNQYEHSFIHNTYTYACMHACIHTYIPLHINTSAYLIDTYIHAQTLECEYTYMLTLIYTYIHIFLDTYFISLTSI